MKTSNYTTRIVITLIALLVIGCIKSTGQDIPQWTQTKDIKAGIRAELRDVKGIADDHPELRKTAGETTMLFGEYFKVIPDDTPISSDVAQDIQSKYDLLQLVDQYQETEESKFILDAVRKDLKIKLENYKPGMANKLIVLAKVGIKVNFKTTEGKEITTPLESALIPLGYAPRVKTFSDCSSVPTSARCNGNSSPLACNAVPGAYLLVVQYQGKVHTFELNVNSSGNLESSFVL